MIRRAVHHDQVTRQRIYEPNHQDLRFRTGDGLAEAVWQTVNPDLPALFFVDQFTHLYATAADREHLETVLATLCSCKQLFVIMTGRGDELTPDQQNWLTARGFHMQPLPGLADPQMESFIQNAADRYNLDVTPPAKQRLLSLAHSVPEVARQTLLRISDAGTVSVDQADVDLHGRSTVKDLWALTRNDIETRYPAVRFILDALGVFHAARVRPQRDIVLLYAAHLWRPGLGPLAWMHRRALARVLARLAPYELRVVDSIIQYPDQAVAEAPTIEAARQALSQFLCGYRRWLHRPCLRRLNRLRESQRWALFDLALGYQDEKRSDLAVNAYSAALRVAPHFGLYNNRGVARQVRGDVAGALADYDQAIALNPRYAGAYNNRGNVRRAQGDVTGALADYDQAIVLDPQYATACYNRGATRKAQGDVAGALADFDQAIALDPQYAAAYFNRGNARRAQGDVAGALADYDQAIALDSQDAAAYNNRGLARADQGDVTGALADFDQAIALFPDGPDKADALQSRGMLLRHSEDWGQAELAYRQATSLAPRSLYIWLGLADAARAMGDEATYRTALTNAQVLQVDANPYARACLASIAGDTETALALLAKALAADPDQRTWAKDDPDLRWLHDDARFWALIGQSPPNPSDG